MKPEASSVRGTFAFNTLDGSHKLPCVERPCSPSASMGLPRIWHLIKLCSGQVKSCRDTSDSRFANKLVAAWAHEGQMTCEQE